jgi:hypothetical protein
MLVLARVDELRHSVLFLISDLERFNFKPPGTAAKIECLKQSSAAHRA